MKLQPTVFMNHYDRSWCDRVRDQHWSSELAKSAFVGEGHLRKRYRRTEMILLDDSKLEHDLSTLFSLAAQRWEIDVDSDGHIEMQMLKYTSENLSEYKVHQDCFNNSYYDRKISAIIMLSDPNDYQGGRLDFCDEGSYRLPMGSAVVFPSNLSHAVTPVVQGTRFTLVAWQHGYVGT